MKFYYVFICYFKSESVLELWLSSSVSSPNLFHLQPPPSVRQLAPRMPSMGPGAPNFSDPRPFAQLHQKGMNTPAVQSYIPSSASQGRSSSGYPAMDKNMQSLREVEQRPDGNGNQLASSSAGTVQERERSVPVPGLEKQQLHFQQSLLPCMEPVVIITRILGQT